jgi:hypothetical protein
MSLEKVAIKNERPGIMLTPGLRPPGESDDEPESLEVLDHEKTEEGTPVKA